MKRTYRNARAALVAATVVFGAVLGFGFGKTIKPAPATAAVEALVVLPPEPELPPPPSMDELRARWAPASVPTTRGTAILSERSYVASDNHHNHHGGHRQ